MPPTLFKRPSFYNPSSFLNQSILTKQKNMSQKSITIIFFIACLLTGTLTSAQSPEGAYNQVMDFLQIFGGNIKTGNADVDYCLDKMNSNYFDFDFGPLIQALRNAGCFNGLDACNFQDLANIVSKLQANGIDPETIKKVEILIGSIIGSAVGAFACEGSSTCEQLVAKVGAAVTCLSMSKEVFEQIVDAVTDLEKQLGDLVEDVVDSAQDAIDSITNWVYNMKNGIENAIDSVIQGAQDGAADALKGITSQIAQGISDLFSSS